MMGLSRVEREIFHYENDGWMWIPLQQSYSLLENF